MSYQEDIAKLENIIGKLMIGMDALRKENAGLKSTLATRESELADLRNERESLQDERSTVQNRVSKILGAIEDWEKMADVPAGQLALDLNEGE
jgi:FtsZ-binding cell division protein ZapB